MHETLFGSNAKNLEAYEFKKQYVTKKYSITKLLLVVSERYFDCILAEPGEGCERR